MNLKLQDELVSVLIGLARATFSNEDKMTPDTDLAILKGLSALQNPAYDDENLSLLITQVKEEKRKLIPLCFECAFPCGKNNDYNMEDFWNVRDEIFSIKSLILFGLQGIARYAYPAFTHGKSDNTINRLIYNGLFAIGMDDWGKDELLPIALEIGAIHKKCFTWIQES